MLVNFNTHVNQHLFEFDIYINIYTYIDIIANSKTQTRCVLEFTVFVTACYLIFGLWNYMHVFIRISLVEYNYIFVL